MTRRSLKLSTLLVTLSILSVSTTVNASSNTTLTDRINAIPDLSTLSLALSVSGLDQVFNGRPTIYNSVPSQYTIYGPTDAAFSNVADALGCSDSLELANGLVATGLLVPVLEVHASAHVQSLAAILDGGTVNTLSTTFPPLMSGVSATGTYLASSGNDLNAPPEIIVSDLDSINGVLHIINSVLLPVAPEIVDAALAGEGYCL